MYMFSTMEEHRYHNFVSLTPSTEQCCHMLCPKWRGLVRAELGTSSVNRLERMKSVQLQKDWCERRQLESGDHGPFPPCHWCGEPTSNWCEHCHVVDPAVPKTCICADCDEGLL